MVSARNLIGIIGNVISFCLFLWPALTFYGIIKKKVVEEEFEVSPYVLNVLICAFWVFYGMPFVHPHSILVLTSNSVGLVIHFIYVTIICIYAANTVIRKKVLVILLLEAIFFAAVVLLTMLWSFLQEADRRSRFVSYCAIGFIELGWIPLLKDMREATKTKSVRSLSFWFSLTYVVNGVCWTTYAVMEPFDAHVLATSGCGAILGLVQLIQYACYCSCKESISQVHHVDLELGN